ncbi:MAG: hypothetical protein WCH34_17940, partial [Bacteroidota bacterium]
DRESSFCNRESSLTYRENPNFYRESEISSNTTFYTGIFWFCARKMNSEVDLSFDLMLFIPLLLYKMFSLFF